MRQEPRFMRELLDEKKARDGKVDIDDIAKQEEIASLELFITELKAENDARSDIHAEYLAKRTPRQKAQDENHEYQIQAQLKHARTLPENKKIFDMLDNLYNGLRPFTIIDAQEATYEPKKVISIPDVK